MRRPTFALLLTAALLILAAAWSNHFHNDFHFDDFHTVVDNPAIRSLSNVPRFFTDAGLFSTLPDHHSWRPLVMASLAVDYALGKSIAPFWFHVSTFFWFLVQLALMAVLFTRIMQSIAPDPRNRYFALAAATLYGLHPATADTVNYVIQRGELYSTLGVVAGLTLYATFPNLRRTGLYLVPVALGMVSKPPALIFPALIAVYALLIERCTSKQALRDAVPSIVLCLAAGILTARMTPPAFAPGASSATLFRATQPLVLLHFFKSFFLPTELTADTDWSVVAHPLSTFAVTGYAFLLALIALIRIAARRDEWRPAAFGLAWFILAFLPAAMMPVAEVMNDHRMYFPFIGLTLALAWAARMLPLPRPRLALATAAVIFAVAAYATHARNEVWRTDESLWRDVVEKSPHNGRGLMNYGLALMQRGATADALAYFERAQTYTPNYDLLEINIAIANGTLGRTAEAERHFQRALTLSPNTSAPVFFYGRWLHETGRRAQALTYLETAVRLNPYDAPAADLLARVRREKPAAETPEHYLALSLAAYQAGHFDDCITQARAALNLRPTYAEAHNNIAAAYNALGRWDEGIAAAREALRLKPDFQLAKNNLAYARSEREKAK